MGARADPTLRAADGRADPAVGLLRRSRTLARQCA